MRGILCIGSLSPGRYRLTVGAPKYQAQQARALEIPVAGRLELNFRLRPLYDVWEAGQYRSWLLPESQQVLGYYGPDVDTSRVAVFNANRGLISPLEISLSDVVSPNYIENLPLAGPMFIHCCCCCPALLPIQQPLADLGFPWMASGPLPPTTFWMVSKTIICWLPVRLVWSLWSSSRVSRSTANYSAEYGRTSGFIANAITHSGTNLWHGAGFVFGESQVLNANGFEENAQGIAGPPSRRFYRAPPLPVPFCAIACFSSAGLKRCDRMAATIHNCSRFRRRGSSTLRIRKATPAKFCGGIVPLRLRPVRETQRWRPLQHQPA